MTALSKIARPEVVFDANNDLHREYYYIMKKTNTWGNCPVVFMLSPEYLDVISMIEKLLVEYYINKEFSK